MTVDRTHRIGALGKWPLNAGAELTTGLAVQLMARCSANRLSPSWWLKIAVGECPLRYQPRIHWGVSFAKVIIGIVRIGIVRSKISKQVMDGYCHKNIVNWSPTNPKTIAALEIGCDRQAIWGQLPYCLCPNGSVGLGAVLSPLIVQVWQQEGDR